MTSGRRLFRFDRARRDTGISCLAGVDEAGRGPWAGPLVAVAVVLPPDFVSKKLNDSKKVSPSDREKLFEEIRREAVAYSVAVVEHHVVDALNVVGATFQAMRTALAGLKLSPDLVLVDGPLRIRGYEGPQETLVDGDARSASIAAASILAKVTRDRLMVQAHAQFPDYGFHEHKGYGTPSHRKVLLRLGPCQIHRRSFAPVWQSAAPSLPFSAEEN